MFRVTLVLTLALGAMLAAPPAQADEPVRILLTGDSITLGRHEDFTWRYRLDKEFIRQGVPVDFVGSLNTPYVDPGYPSASYMDPNFDHDHFAKAGWWIRDMIGRIGAEVSAQDPDVVVLDGGAADLLYGTSPEETAVRLRAWVAAVRVAKASVRIVLAQVLTMDKPSVPGVNDRINAYDALLPGVADELSLPGSPITVAETMHGWSPTPTYSVEGLHLSPTGETLYAQRVAEELHSDGLLPQSPDIYRVLSWTRTERAVVNVTGRVAHVKWAHQVLSNGRIRWRRTGGRWTTSGLHPNAYVTFGVTAGVYEVQTQVMRQWLTGPWGPTTQVRVVSTKPRSPARVVVGRSGVHWTRVAGASSYVVKFRRAHHRWITRHTARLQVRYAHVSVARVRAVNSMGTSGWRTARV